MGALRSWVATAMALGGACASPADAQDAGDFASITLAIAAGLQPGAPWEGAWESTPQVSAEASTPFHRGEARAGARAWANDGGGEDLPDFTAIHAYGGWGPAFRLPAGATLSPVLHLGALAFRFDDDGDFTGALRNETELTAGASLRAAVPLHRGLGAWAGVDAVHVFTRPAENLLFLEAGVSVTLRAPGWLRDSLR